MAELLSTLDDIDWSVLEHAYGEASSLPAVLRVFAFGSLAERQQKLEDEWWGSIIHQGTYSSATDAVVPFLIEIALADSTVERHEIVAELQQITIGFVERLCQRPRKMLFDKFVTPKQSLYDDERWVQASYEHAVSAIGELSRLLQDPDEDTRIATTFLLSSFVTQWQSVATTLLDALDQEPNTRVRCAVIVSLMELRAALIEHSPDDAKRLNEVLTRRWRGSVLHRVSTMDAEHAAMALTMLSCDDDVEQVTAVAACRMLVESEFEMPHFELRRGGGPCFLWEVYDALDGRRLDRRSMIAWALEHDDARVRSEGLRLVDTYCRRYRDVGPMSLVEVLSRMLQDERWSSQHAEIAEELIALGERGLAASRSVMDRFPNVRKRLDSFKREFAFWDCEASAFEASASQGEPQTAIAKSLRQLEAIHKSSDENLRVILNATQNGSPKVRAAAVVTFHRVTQDHQQTVELILKGWELDFISVPLLRLLGECGAAASHLKDGLDTFIHSNERYVNAGWLSGICLLDDRMLKAARESRSRIP